MTRLFRIIKMIFFVTKLCSLVDLSSFLSIWTTLKMMKGRRAKLNKQRQKEIKYLLNTESASKFCCCLKL